MKYSMSQWTAARLNREIEDGNINFDLAIQRSSVWTEEQKSNLIYSILKDFPTGVMYFRELPDDKCSAVDGKQRSTAIREFLNDKFLLKENMDIVKYRDEEYDLSDMLFSELPDWAKDKIKEYSFTICLVNSDSDSEIAEFFYLINNGTPLKSIEKTRVKAVSISEFQRIGTHKMVQVGMSKSQKAAYGDEERAMQMYGILNMPDTDFSRKAFAPYIMDVSVSQEQSNRIIQCLDWINEVYESLDMSDKDDKRVSTKLKGKIHIVSMVYLANKFIESGLAKYDLADCIKHFFTGCGRSTSINKDYNDSCSNGSASASKIAKRKAALDNITTEYLAKKEKRDNAESED